MDFQGSIQTMKASAYIMFSNHIKKKGNVLFILSVSVLLVLFLFGPSASAEVIRLGDVNNDQAVNVQDVVMVIKHVLELESLTVQQKFIADVNTDGLININDVTLIMQKSLGIIDQFPVRSLEVVSVTVTDPKTITVKFNRFVDDPLEAIITVQHETTIIPVSLSWNDKLNQVQLKRLVNYLPGNYKVFVEGLNLEQEEFSLVIEAEKIDKLVITSSKLVIAPDDSTRAIGYYRVYNQYGNDITGAMIASNLSWESSVGVIADDSKGMFTVTKDSDFTTEDTLIVTVTDPVTTKQASREVSVVDSMIIEEFEFGLITPLPVTTKRVEVNKEQAARIPIDKALDDDGINRNRFFELNGQIILDSSDPLVTLSLMDIDGGSSEFKQAAIFVNTTGIDTGRTIEITVEVKATGETFSIPLQIHPPAVADDVSIGTIKEIVAAGDTNIYVPLTLKNQFGEKLTPTQVVAVYLDGGLTISSNNHAVIDTADLSIVTAAGNYLGFLKISDTGIKGSVTLTVTVNNSGKSDSRIVEVLDRRSPAIIKLPADMTANLIQGALTGFQFSFIDQYNKPYAAVSEDNFNYRVVIALTRISGADSAVTIEIENIDIGNIEFEQITDAQSKNRYTAIAAGDKTGTYLITGNLQYCADGLFASPVDLDSVAVSIKVVATDHEGLTYSVKAIPTLAGGQGGDRGITGSDRYAYPVVVEAEDEDGTKYAVPVDNIISVTLSDDSVARIGNSSQTESGIINIQRGNWVVAGRNAVGWSANRSVTLYVSVNTAAGVEMITETVTISHLSPKAQGIFIATGDLRDKVTAHPYSFPPDAISLDQIIFSDAAAAAAGHQAFIFIKDQYNIWFEYNDNLSALDLVQGTPVKLSGHGDSTDNGLIYDNNSKKFKIAATDTGSVEWAANTAVKFSIIIDTAIKVFDVLFIDAGSLQ